MAKHLDWHFVTKRRIRESAGRAQGRSWFSSESDWLSGDVVSAEGIPSASDSQGGATSASTTAGGKAKADEVKIDREALMKQKVVAPSDAAAVAPGPDDIDSGASSAHVCAICQEPFKSEWSEADEEWVFWNAVQVDGKLYHATCHAEAAAARLKIKEDARASRDLTPVTGPKSPPSIARWVKEEEGTEGTSESARKRKAEEVLDSYDADEDDVKRIKAEPV